MPKGKRDIIDKATPVATEAEDMEGVAQNDGEVEEQPWYNLRRWPRLAEPFRQGQAHMDLEDELGPGEVEEGEEEYRREPDQRMQGQMGRGQRLEPYDRSSCWLEYLE